MILPLESTSTVPPVENVPLPVTSFKSVSSDLILNVSFTFAVTLTLPAVTLTFT